MFRGEHVHTIDGKGRLSIPAAFRNEILRRSEKPPILTRFKDYLALYPYEDWLEIEQALKSKSKLQPEVQKYTRFVISGSTECPIDSQGRILVPPNLRAHAKLESKVTLAGNLECIEIWDAATYDAGNLDIVENFDSIQRSVDEAPTS